MKNFIFITAILEFLAGGAMFFVPYLVPDLAEGSPAALSLAKMYGGAALTMGFLALQIWKNFENEAFRKLFLNTFLIFHATIAVAGLRGYLEGAMHKPEIMVIHTVFGLITAYFYFTTSK